MPKGVGYGPGVMGHKQGNMGKADDAFEAGQRAQKALESGPSADRNDFDHAQRRRDHEDVNAWEKGSKKPPKATDVA